MTWRNLVSAGVVVGLCGGALAAGTALQSDSGGQVGEADARLREFMRSALAVCPAERTPDDQVLVAAASLPGIPGQDVPGTVAIRAGERSLSSIAKPGATASVTQVPPAGDLTVEAEGGLAPGLVTGVVTSDSRGEGRGLQSAPCVTSAAESWFMGGGATAGDRSVLLLSNPTQSDSLVDITAFSKGGQLDVRGDDGVTVPAGETVPVRLEALVPDTEAVAVRVRTRTGLIAASLTAERMNGLTPMGTELGVDAGPARRTVVLSGMPGGAGGRELRLLATEGSGSVRITALTENGPLPLLAGEQVPLKKGNLTVFDITDELAGRAAALRISGDVAFIAESSATTAVDESIKAKRAAAVAAAERALKEAKGDAERAEAETALTKAETANAIEPGEDFAWFGQAPAIAGTTAVTALDAELDTTVLLTGTGGDATVDVALLPAAQSGTKPKAARTIEVTDDTTVAVPIRPPGPGTYTAVITRTAGPGEVHVGHVQLDDGQSLTGYAASPLRVWIPTTAATPNYAP